MKEQLSTEQLNDLINHIVSKYSRTVLLDATNETVVLATVVLKHRSEHCEEFDYLVKTFGEFERTEPTIESITACQYVNKKYLLRVRLTR